MDFHDVVRKRRMVRSFTTESVDPASVERILDTARRGPSAGYSQGVEFVLVTDAAMRAKVGRVDDESLQKLDLPLFVAQAPVQVVVCVSEERYTTRYREPDKQRLREGNPDENFWFVPYWHTDAGAALMLILLAAVNEGLGAGVAGVMGVQGQQRLQNLLGIPSTYTAVAVVAIGHAAAGAKGLSGSAKFRARRPLSEVVHREHW